MKQSFEFQTSPNPPQLYFLYSQMVKNSTVKFEFFFLKDEN